MLIYAFAQYYPATFKPYFDTQFAEFLRAGHEVRVFARGAFAPDLSEKVLSYGLVRRTRHYPVSVHEVPLKLPAALLSVARSPRLAAGRLQRARRTGGPKRALLEALRMLRLPAREPDICLVHDLTTATWFGWLRQIYPHAALAMYYHGGEHAAGTPLDSANARNAFEAFDVVFTNTRFSANNAVARGCPPEKIDIVPVGFDLDQYAPEEPRRYRPQGTLRLLTAGRMSEEKGHIHALEAVRRLVAEGGLRLHYTVTGAGYLRPRLERFVDAHGLRPYVTFTGAVVTEELILTIGASDVVLLPSIQVGNWLENQACIVQEAMLMKAVVVASATGGVPESIAPELAPLLLPPGDPSAIADAIRKVDAMGADEMRRLGEAGRDFTAARYDIRDLNEQLLRIATRRSSLPAGSLQPI